MNWQKVADEKPEKMTSIENPGQTNRITILADATP